MARPKKAPEGGQIQGENSTGAVERALAALRGAEEALELLAAERREQKLSDTRARNVAREIHEQIKVIRVYGDGGLWH